MGANQTALPDLVARLEALEKEATPGPWEWCRFDSSEGGEDGVHCPQDESAYVKPDGTWHTLTVCRGMTGPRKAQNAQFISAMRNALPQLLTELKRLQSLYTDQVISHQRALCDIQAWQKASGLGREEWDYLQSTPDELADKIKQLESERDTLRSANERLKSENEQLNHSKILVPEATPELIEKAREIRENRTSEMDALRSANERMRAIAEFLFDRLDDVDTAGDMAKADDALYRNLCERAHKRRFEVATTDGYEIKFKEDCDLRRAAEAVGDE